MRRLFYYKMRQKFIIKCDGNLLQNATVLLENAQVITRWDNFIIKCDSCHKMRRLLRIATVHSFTYSFKFTYKCFVRLTFHNSYERYQLG